MVSCLACGISHKARKSGIVFHRFPKDLDQRRAWLTFVNKDETSIPKNCYLCSQHFDERDFDRTSNLKIALKKNSVPSKLVFRSKYTRKTKEFIAEWKNDDLENANLHTDESLQEGIIIKSSPNPLNVYTSPCPSFQRKMVIEDCFYKKRLRNELSTMSSMCKNKSEQIRRLQKQSWAQKKRIVYLTAEIKRLKKKFMVNEDTEI